MCSEQAKYSPFQRTISRLSPPPLGPLLSILCMHLTWIKLAMCPASLPVLAADLGP